MNRDSLDEFIRDSARAAYHAPPPTPRTELWARIEAARHSPIQRRPARRLHWWTLGIAASIILVIGLGEFIARGGAEGEEVPVRTGEETTDGVRSTPVAETPPVLAVTAAADSSAEAEESAEESEPAEAGIPADDLRPIIPRPRQPAPEPIRLATFEHLGRAEILLTGFIIDARGGHIVPGLDTDARELLSTTRLLLDTPGGTERHIAGLLLDLELVLAQLAHFPANPTLDELELIDQALTENDIVTRLRLAIPSGPLLALR